MMGASSSSKGDGATVQNVLRFRCGVRNRKTAFYRSSRLLGLAPVFSVYGRTGRPAPAARFIPYPLRNVGGTFYVRYGTNQTVSVLQNSSGGAGRRRPDRAVHSCTRALQSARTGRALAASGISWTDGETSNTTPNVNLSPTPFRLLEGFTLRPCARSVRGQVAHRRVSAHDLR